MISTILYRKLISSDILPLVAKLSQVCIVVGLLWICFVNFIFSRKWFISENAFRSSQPEIFLTSSDNTNRILLVNSFLDELRQVKESEGYDSLTSGIEYMRKKTKELNLETYTQEYPIYTGNGTSAKGYNIYTYLRSKRSSQKDCLLIAYRHGLDQYNMTYHLGINNVNINKVTRYGEIATVLTLMEYFSSVNWLSRDIIFFGYDGNLQYGTAIRHFLKEYYEGSDPHFIRGGVIRQAMSLEFKSDDFNMYGLQLGNDNYKFRGEQW